MSKQKKLWGHDTRLYLASVESRFEPIRPKMRDVICLDTASEPYRKLVIEGVAEALHEHMFGYPADTCIGTVMASVKRLPDGTCEQATVYTAVIFCNRTIVWPPVVSLRQATVAAYARSRVLMNTDNEHDGDVWAMVANFRKILRSELP